MMPEKAIERWRSEHGSMSEGGRLSVKQLIQRGMAAWERDEFATALVDFREVLEREPDFPDVRNKAGLCRAMLGDVEGALHEFEHAVRVNPDYAEAHLNRAIVLNELGRYEEARDAFQRAGDLNHRPGEGFPADLGNRIAIAHAKLGDLYVDAEEIEQAAEEYGNALRIRPTYLDIRSKLAHALMRMGELERAREELVEIVRENPYFAAARLRLGVVLHRMGRTEEAVQEWKTCLEQDPDNRRARSYLAGVGRTDAIPGGSTDEDARGP